MSRPEEDYVTITVTLLEKRDKSIRVEAPGWITWKWIPRWWLDKASDLDVVRVEIGTELALRLLGDEAMREGVI